MLPSLFSHRLSFRLLIPITAFLFAAVAGISVAAWLDAPGAPPNYGMAGCSPQPCSQEDFKPMNLSATAQTKRSSATFEGDVISNQFLDRQNNAYFLDPASPILAGTLSGALNISQTAPGAKLVVNNPSTATKTGVSGDTIYAYADSVNAALSAEQGNPAGYGVYSSGGINYFGGNVGIGINPSDKLDVNGWIRAAGTGQGADPAMRIGVYKTDNTGGISGWWLSQNQTGEFAIHQNSVGDRLIIDGSGNVGIGTASPGKKLDVAGDIGVAGNLCLNGDCKNSWPSGVWTQTGNDIYYTNGNVGIGTNSPQAKLEVGNGGNLRVSTGLVLYDTNGPYSGCTAGVPSIPDPIGSGCTCKSGLKTLGQLGGSPTCNYNSFMAGGNNYSACVYSCTLTGSPVSTYKSADINLDGLGKPQISPSLGYNSTNFGGMYYQSNSWTCDNVNPYTNSCTCPSGFTPGQTGNFSFFCYR